MSSIKKSASFRSRIPVRRTHARRCASPQSSRITPCASTSAIQRKARVARPHPNCQIDHSSVWKGHRRRYSSSTSSYSSSDESQESEAPLQKLLRHQHQGHNGHNGNMARTMMTSTDALSLDGLLDTVSSCGSFHSPPMSPLRNGRGTGGGRETGGFGGGMRLTTKESVCSSSTTTINNHHVSYESLDKFPINGYQLETLKMGDNAYRGGGSSSTTTVSCDQRGSRACDEESSSCEKQRQLSDWYYIKTSPKARQWTDDRGERVDYLKRFPQKSASATQFPGPPLSRAPENGYIHVCDNRISTRDQRRLPLPLMHHNDNDDSLQIPYENVRDFYREKSSENGDTSSNSFERVVGTYTKPASGSIYNHHHHNPLHSSAGNNSTSSNNNFYCTAATFIQSENNLKDFHFYENLVEQKNKHPPGSAVPQSPVSISTIETANHHHHLLHRPINTEQTYYPQKSTTTYQSEGELSGSYVSLECPSPPGPPSKLSDPRRDPQTRLGNFLKNFYIEFALKESLIPPWAPPIAPGALCPARLELELRLYGPSHHGVNDIISVDQILTPLNTKDGPQIEAPRRVLIDCPAWIPRTALAYRILYAWAKEQPWPPRGTPVALAIYVPLNEIKGSISNYVSKELLPKGSANPFANGFGGFNGAWNSLGNLKGKLLFILDGYDSIYKLQRTPPSGISSSNLIGTSKRKGRSLPQDIIDLLEGRLFPDSRVIVISSAASCEELLPLVQRHITLEGLTWGRSASLLGGGQWGAPTILLDLVQSCKYLRNAVRTPLGCLAISCIYEAMGCVLPTEEMEIIEAIVNCVCSTSRAADMTHLPELGRLALFTLKTKRASVSTSEISMYCSTTESAIMNCLEKTPLFGRTAKRKGEHLYTMICPGISEYLAAVYLASLARNRPGLLAAEIAGLSFNDGDEIDPAIIKTLQFTLRLLGNSGHILISKLSPLWLNPNSVFNLALAGNDSGPNLVALCDLLGLSKVMPVSPLEPQPSWIQIRSSLHELKGWALVLKSSNCCLRNIEVHYQAEKNFALESRTVFDNFLDALAINESVTTLRISSLIECDAKETEISYLANSLPKALLKPKLESFELILTLLEEDPPALKLQSVVNALCKTIPKIQKLSSLLLDLGLCTSQLVQVCSMLELCPQITRLSLPHLRCDRGAVNSLSNLLKYRTITSLALPSCWGARDDPPSSSGVSMGSGSGSSTTTSGLLKQSSLTGAPSPRSFSNGLFSSLPRGVLAPSSSMGRSATLPRQPLDGPPDKRSTDSVVSKSWYPTPACDGGPHTSGSLHELLATARDPHSRVHGLDLSKAQLSLDDSMCLGETVRLSPSLHSLKLEGTSRLSEILPAILGASESSSIQMLSLGSPRLIFEDGAVAMGARALTNCVNLRLLSIDGWTLRLENMITLSALRYFLSFTSARELGLSNCRLHIPFCKHDTAQKVTYESRSVVVVKCAGAQIIFADNIIIRGPQLLQYLTGFTHLRELDVSTPTRSSLSTSTSTSPLIVDDKSIIGFFQLLQSQFHLLNSLKMCNWIIHLDDPVKTFKALQKTLRSSPLSHVKLDGISVVDKAKKHRIESQFIAALISALPSLRWMGMSLLGMTESQITTIGNALVDLKGNEIDFRLNDSTIESAKLMTQSICLDSKFDIRVSSTFGSPPGILVHAERNSGHKSLSRRRKD